MEGFTLHEYIAQSVTTIAHKKGKNLSDIALELNLSPSFIYQIQRGKKHYNVEHLFVISRFLNCEISEFFPSNYTNFKRCFPLYNWSEEQFQNHLENITNDIVFKKTSE